MTAEELLIQMESEKRCGFNDAEARARVVLLRFHEHRKGCDECATDLLQCATGWRLWRAVERAERQARAARDVEDAEDAGDRTARGTN